MKQAVATLVCGDFHRRMAEMTQPTIRAYARRLGADYVVWDTFRGHTLPGYQKLALGPLLGEYDRVLYLDNDVLVRDDAPDIFALVPPDRAGLLEETRYVDRVLDVVPYMIKAGLDPAVWDRKYYNTGVMVFSRCHRKLFDPPAVEWDSYMEQTHINVMIARTETKVFPLPYRCNRLIPCDAYYGERRTDCYFLHYAGMWHHLGHEDQLRMIANDIAVWERSKPAYRFRKSIAFAAEGSLAEQVAAEPTVRYAREVVYPGDNLVVISDWPEVFRHLGLPVYATVEQVPFSGMYHVYRTLGERPDATRPAFAPHLVHACDVAALHTLGLALPLDAKRPRLEADAEASRSLSEKLGGIDATRLVVVHAGCGSQPNTFPADVWQAYLNALVDSLMGAGLRVAVIGTRAAAGPETIAGLETKAGLEASAGLEAKAGLEPKVGLEVVELDTSRCLDLVDRLSLAEIVALISQAPVLVSNDSAAVQIAGAFANWIGVVATSRRPEHVLAWREGSPYRRAKNLERGAMYDDYVRPLAPGEFRDASDCTAARLRECLPEPGAVVEFVRLALGDRAGA